MRRIELIKDGANQWDGNRSGLPWSAPDAKTALKAGVGRKSVGNDGARDTLGSVDGGLVSMLHTLHGGYIWV